MSQMLSDDMCNCWVAYFAPGDPDRYGRTRSNTVTFHKANWRNVQSETVTVDGKDYSISHSVYLRDAVIVGGYLLKLTQPVSYTETQVANLNPSLTCPRTGEIVSVSEQSDLDNHDDKVFVASF